MWFHLNNVNSAVALTVPVNPVNSHENAGVVNGSRPTGSALSAHTHSHTVL